MERDALIERYAKKIFGFACQKTQNRQEAEDLSQSILAKLCEVPWEKKAIADMDGYIYRICLNTYYTRQRKEARYWTCVDYDALPERPDDGRTPEEAFLLGEDLRKLRREVMRLCRLRREAIVLFYYEHKSSREIAARLGVPESTLRWHLGEAKHRLKERMDMKDTVFEPIRLQVYICGNGNDPEMSGLRHDLLTQNICIACADSPKRVEEIAARLGTAAAFIESRLPALVQAGYLQSAGGKYRTTFFIADAPFITKLKAFERKLLAPAAEALGKAARKVLPQVREIGFEGSGLDEALLLWDVAAIAAHTFMNGIANSASAEPPVRGDGSRHWVLASWTDEEVLRRCTLTPEERAYLRCAGGMAGKHSGDGKTTVQQFDPPAATADRAFCPAGRVRALRRLYEICREKLTPNEYEREMIAELAADGYAVVEDGQPRLAVPYFTAAEHETLLTLLKNELLPAVEAAAGDDPAGAHRAFVNGLLPASVSGGEREFLLSRFYEPNAMLYLAGLPSLTDEQKRVCCTVAYECT